MCNRVHLGSMSKAVRVSDDVYERAVEKSKKDDISIIDAVDQMALSEGEEELVSHPDEETEDEPDDQPADDHADENPVEESEMCVSDEAREKAEEIAEEKDVPIDEVADEVIDEFASDDDDTGDVVGYCKGCGYEFHESDTRSPSIPLVPESMLATKVECPIDSCARSDNPRVGDLADDVPDDLEEPIRGGE